MGSLPVLTSKEVTTILEHMGFLKIRQKDSHNQFRHPDGRGTTVPFHSGRDISPVLLRKIIKDIGLTVEEFLKSL